MDCFLGIDCGTSVVKVALFDLDGKELAVAAASMETTSPQPGWMEYDPELLWTTACTALRSLLSRYPEARQHLRGIGVTGAGNGLTLIDAAGKPVRPGILAVDNRALATMSHDGEFAARARKLHGQGVWPGQTIELLRWVALQEPHHYERAARVFVIKDYVKWRLTEVFASDTSEQSKIGLLDLETPTATPRLLDHYGLGSAQAKLPTVGDSTQVIGHVTPHAAAQTGLPHGIPVVNGLADIDASALGSGAVAAGQLSIVAGTWSINQYFLAQPENRTAIFGTSRHAVPGVWEELEASASSTANLTWFVREACRDLQTEATASSCSVYELVEQLVATVPPATTPVFFHPYLFGSNTQANAKAGFYGLAGWQERRHLLAALFEGVVFGHTLHVRRLLEGGRKATAVKLSGGASRSTVWSQMFADVLDLPVEIPAAKEVGALGGALCAAVGTGRFATLPEAAAHMVKPLRTHTPQPDLKSRYEARFQAYQEITRLMTPVWDKLESAFTAAP